MIDIIKVVLLNTIFKELGETKKRRFKKQEIRDNLFAELSMDKDFIARDSQEKNLEYMLEHNVKLEQECIAY